MTACLAIGMRTETVKWMIEIGSFLKEELGNTFKWTLSCYVPSSLLYFPRHSTVSLFVWYVLSYTFHFSRSFLSQALSSVGLLLPPSPSTSYFLSLFKRCLGGRWLWLSVATCISNKLPRHIHLLALVTAVECRRFTNSNAARQLSMKFTS